MFTSGANIKGGSCEPPSLQNFGRVAGRSRRLAGSTGNCIVPYKLKRNSHFISQHAQNAIIISVTEFVSTMPAMVCQLGCHIERAHILQKPRNFNFDPASKAQMTVRLLTILLLLASLSFAALTTDVRTALAQGNFAAASHRTGELPHRPRRRSRLSRSALLDGPRLTFRQPARPGRNLRPPDRNPGP